MWQIILKRYWLVATFRESPANTPYAPAMFFVLSILFFIIVSVQWSLASSTNPDLPSSFFAGGAILFSYYFYTYVFLSFSQKKNRFIQTINCLLSSYIMIHLFAFPLLIVTQLMVEDDHSIITLVLLIFSFIFALFLTIWQLLITANIFRQALELNFFSGILSCLGLMAFSFIILSFLQ